MTIIKANIDYLEDLIPTNIFPTMMGADTEKLNLLQKGWPIKSFLNLIESFAV